MIAEKRRQIWEAHKAFILPMIREAIPAAAREFEIYYTTKLLNHVFERFNPETWSAEEVVTEKLKILANEVVSIVITQLITDDGMLRDGLHTTRAYVDQLFSHDYPQLRKICLEDFGLSGTDL